MNANSKAEEEIIYVSCATIIQPQRFQCVSLRLSLQKHRSVCSYFNICSLFHSILHHSIVWLRHSLWHNVMMYNLMFYAVMWYWNMITASVHTIVMHGRMGGAFSITLIRSVVSFVLYVSSTSRWAIYFQFHSGFPSYRSMR